MSDEFQSFGKITRLSKQTAVVTEKIDGTNAQIFITEDGDIKAGSRNRWITPENDNFGFAQWVEANKKDLLSLGPGRHFGEWWGLGIQRGYGKKEKTFSLFNAWRWGESKPDCCSVVPLIAIHQFETLNVSGIMSDLLEKGSQAAPGFMDPEGIIIYLPNVNVLYKKTYDDSHKGT